MEIPKCKRKKKIQLFLYIFFPTKVSLHILNVFQLIYTENLLSFRQLNMISETNMTHPTEMLILTLTIDDYISKHFSQFIIGALGTFCIFI